MKNGKNVKPTLNKKIPPINAAEKCDTKDDNNNYYIGTCAPKYVCFNLGAALEPKSWSYAFEHYLHLYNVTVQHHSQQASLYTVCTDSKSNLNLLQTIGCCVYNFPLIIILSNCWCVTLMLVFSFLTTQTLQKMCAIMTLLLSRLLDAYHWVLILSPSTILPSSLLMIFNDFFLCFIFPNTSLLLSKSW